MTKSRKRKILAILLGVAVLETGTCLQFNAEAYSVDPATATVAVGGSISITVSKSDISSTPGDYEFTGSVSASGYSVSGDISGNGGTVILTAGNTPSSTKGDAKVTFGVKNADSN